MDRKSMTPEQLRVARIIGRAVAAYLKADQQADYALPERVAVVIEDKDFAAFAKTDFDNGVLGVERLGGDRVRLVAHKFPRRGLWNGPDILPNTTFRRMLSSLFHDLIWLYRKELAAAWGSDEVAVMRWGGDALYLVWMWASSDSWWGRREAWLSFQVTQAAAPVYHKAKKLLGKATAVVAVSLCAVCAGCFATPKGRVVEVEGADTILRVMREQGDGLGWRTNAVPQEAGKGGAR